MSRQLIFLLLCAVVSSLAYVNALEQANCVFNNVNLYGTATGPAFFSTSGDYNTESYNISTTYDFPDHRLYLNITMHNGIATTLKYAVNGNAFTTKVFPTDPRDVTDRYLMTGLISGQTSCTVLNWIDLWVLQSGQAPRFESCNYYYGFWITTTNSAVCGDPQFVGLRGQSFQVHGIDGAVYNLISTKSFALNSKFRFLSGPRPCPIMPTTGKKSLACWSHDGSYLESVAFITSENEKFLVQSGTAENGFSKVSMNERALSIGDSFSFSQGSIVYNSTHEITLNIGVFYIEIENVDGFVNLRRIRVATDDFHLLSENGGAHGLLGQTWQNKRYSGKVKEIQGNPDDYVIANDDIFGTDFIFSRMVSE